MSHKLTLRTLTLNKEWVKKGRENIEGGQECSLRGGEIVFVKEVATPAFVRSVAGGLNHFFLFNFQGLVVEEQKKF